MMTTWNLTRTKSHVLICNGSSCMRKGGEEVTEAIRDEISRLDLDAEVHTTRTRCNGRCKDACVVVVYPEGTWYKAATEEIGRKIIRNEQAPVYELRESILYEYEESTFVKVSEDSIKGIEKPAKELKEV